GPVAAARPGRAGDRRDERDGQRLHHRLRPDRLRRAAAAGAARARRAPAGLPAGHRRRGAHPAAAAGSRTLRRRMTRPLFEPLGDGSFRATEVTRGPWDPGAQHGGAPSALLGRAIEAVEPGAEMRVARVTLEL